MDPYRVSRFHKLIKDKFPMKMNHDPGDMLRYIYGQLQEEINQHQKTRPAPDSDVDMDVAGEPLPAIPEEPNDDV